MKIFLILLPLLILHPDKVNAGFLDKLFGPDEWIGYVIKVMDYGLYKGSDRRERMIFPSSTTYKSKDDCYYYFRKLYETRLKSRYPQTSDAYSSYLFGCIEK